MASTAAITTPNTTVATTIGSMSVLSDQSAIAAPAAVVSTINADQAGRLRKRPAETGRNRRNLAGSEGIDPNPQIRRPLANTLIFLLFSAPWVLPRTRWHLRVATSEGFEPPTYGIEIHCSIQLS